MKHEKIVLVYLCIILIALSGCVNSGQAQWEVHYRNAMNDLRELENTSSHNISEEPNVSVLSVSEATDSFKNLYELSSLQTQDLLWNENLLQMSYYFSAEVPLHQIDTARLYVLDKFVLGQINNYSRTPYEDWMILNGKIREIPNASCKIYIDDILIFQDNYENKQLKSYYENKEVFLDTRACEPINGGPIIATVNQKLPDAAISFQKSIKAGELLVTFDTDKIVDPQIVTSIVDLLSPLAQEYKTIEYLFLSKRECYYRTSTGGHLGAIKQPIPMSEYPLSKATVEAALEETGLFWTITNEEPWGGNRAFFELCDKDEKAIAVISSVGGDRTRVLQLTFFSSSEKTVPLDQKDWEKAVDLATILYGGFEEKGQVFEAFQNTYEEKALIDKAPGAVPKDKERMRWRNEVNGVDCFIGLHRLNVDSGSPTTEIVSVIFSDLNEASSSNE